MTSAGIGDPSKKQTVNVAAGPVKSLKPKITVLSQNSLKLMWHKQNEAKGYRVIVRIDDPVVRKIPDQSYYPNASDEHLKSESFMAVSFSLAQFYVS